MFFCIASLIPLSAKADLPPELLFFDTFDTSIPSQDINFEYELRQNGKLAPIRLTEPNLYATVEDARSHVASLPDVLDGKLGFMPRNPNSVNYGRTLVIAGPDRNFNQSPRFIIEVDVSPAINDVARLSTDWAGVSFGSTIANRGAAPNPNAAQTDGIGIIFRSNGSYALFDGAAMAASGTGLPQPPFRVKIAVEAVDFDGVGPVRVSLFVNGTQLPLGSGNQLDYIRTSGFTANYINVQGQSGVGPLGDLVTGPTAPGTDANKHFADQNWEHLFDNLSISVIHCIKVAPWEVRLKQAQDSDEISVTVPQALIASKAAQVQIRSLDPSIAIPEGAINGILTLNFPQNGPLVQTFKIKALKKGQVQFSLSNPDGVCVNRSVSVQVLPDRLLNPSFELSPVSEETPVPGWSITEGMAGMASGMGHLENYAAIPDGNRSLFLGYFSTVSQAVYGLDPQKTYWLQFYYSANDSTANGRLVVRNNGEDIAHMEGIVPVEQDEPYYFTNLVFRPSAAGTAIVEFSNRSEDFASTLFVDAVTVVEREEDEVVVQNPSFEASGLFSAPEPFSFTALAGWTGVGDFGIETTSGPAPDQLNVLYLRGVSSAQQTLTGLVPGGDYELTYSYASRPGGSPMFQATIGSTALQNTSLSPGSAFQTKAVSFTAGGESEVLGFHQTAEEDASVLIDNVRIHYLGGGSGGEVMLTIAKTANGVKLSWPASASGFKLQETPQLNGNWSDATGLPLPEGEFIVMEQPSNSGNRFYRLIRN